MELIITQMPENGFLGGPKTNSFFVGINDLRYDVIINQLGQREITISSPSGKYEDMLSVYYNLETLLMLFDGQFYPISNAFDGTDITASWKKRSLPSYASADFMIGLGNKLLDYDTILDDILFQNWCSLRAELDLVHNMILYCLSSVKMPKDMQCAFMTEAFKGVCELIHNKHPSFSLPLNQKKKLELKPALLAVVDEYGTDIFAEELARNRARFAQILVNTRNRIAHIKSRQNQVYLNGGECVMYLVKLSLLYRVILFDLLGISENKYKSALMKRIQAVNDHDVMKRFLSTL